MEVHLRLNSRDKHDKDDVMQRREGEGKIVDIFPTCEGIFVAHGGCRAGVLRKTNCLGSGL